MSRNSDRGHYHFLKSTGNIGGPPSRAPMCSNTSLLSLYSHLPRHCLQSTGYLLTEDMWHVAANAITHAFDVTLHCLRQLMTLFHEDSDNFYGDIGHVKVAVRKDCSGIECERLRQLAQQVRAAL